MAKKKKKKTTTTTKTEEFATAIVDTVDDDDRAREMIGRARPCPAGRRGVRSLFVVCVRTARADRVFATPHWRSTRHRHRHRRRRFFFTHTFCRYDVFAVISCSGSVFFCFSSFFSSGNDDAEDGATVIILY